MLSQSILFFPTNARFIGANKVIFSIWFSVGIIPCRCRSRRKYENCGRSDSMSTKVEGVGAGSIDDDVDVVDSLAPTLLSINRKIYIQNGFMIVHECSRLLESW